jgi:hypothetical protein
VDDDEAMTFQGSTDDRQVLKLTRRMLYRWYLPIGIPGLAIAFLLGLHGHGDDAAGVAGGSGSLFFLPWMQGQKTLERNRTTIGLTRAYRIGRDGITITAGFDTVATPWSKVTRVGRSRGQMFVHLGWRKILGIPTSSLTAPERARLYRILRSRGQDTGR